MEIPRSDKKLVLDTQILEHYRALGEKLRTQIVSLQVPLGHGTTSEHLQSILTKGLGADTSKRVYANTKSAVDLRQPDGLLAGYLFARFNTDELELTSDQLYEGDLVSRYVKLNPKIDEAQLRQKTYRIHRREEAERFPRRSYLRWRRNAHRPLQPN